MSYESSSDLAKKHEVIENIKKELNLLNDLANDVDENHTSYDREYAAGLTHAVNRIWSRIVD